MDDMIKQRMIVRQNVLNRACDLLIAEQTIAQNSARIPVNSIKDLTRELESFIWELNGEIDDRTINKTTGIVETVPKKKIVLG